MFLAAYIQGRVAEHRARRHLRRVGFRILRSNVRVGSGEIDILAVDGRCLVAVEVKYRQKGILQADQAIDRSKLDRVEQTLMLFLRRNRALATLHRRIDILLLDAQGNVSHFRGIR
jgi:putative endonuclease